MASHAPLQQLFKVRLCNFRATGINQKGHPPYCIRGNFDGKPFHTSNFLGQGMQPMWPLDLKFDYYCPSVEALSSKYLLLEAYGDDMFLGMCRVDLFSLATGPRCCEFQLRDGSRVNGTLAFEVQLDHVSNVSIYFTSVAISSLGRGAGMDAPSPYLTYGFADGSSETHESAVAPNATQPEFDRLPTIHRRMSYADLTNSGILFELKHARNGLTPGVADVLMSRFEIRLNNLQGIQPGKDLIVPVREMLHSVPGYTFPFSAQFLATCEVRGMPRIAQLSGGLLTDDGVIGGGGGDQQQGTGRNVGSNSGLNSSNNNNNQHHQSVAVNNNFREPNVAYASNYQQQQQSQSNNNNNISSTMNNSYHNYHPSAVRSLSGGGGGNPHSPGRNAPQTSMLTSVAIARGDPAPPRLQDIDVLDDVADKQSTLLQRVNERLQEVSRRRSELHDQITIIRRMEAEKKEIASARRATIDADLRAAGAEKERLEMALRNIALRREEEMRVAAQQATERERARQQLEEEEREVRALQERVLVLRNEMQQHLTEEESRYNQRVREAEEARRRAEQDAEELGALERRLQAAEVRAATRQRDEEQRSKARLRHYSPQRY